MNLARKVDHELSSETLPKLLIVDDEQKIRTLLSRFLEEYYTIRFAENGEEALKAVQAERPDVILMDIAMPVMDGLTAVKHLRENSGYHSIPILFLTASNVSPVRTQAFQLGADDFISKPFEVEELISRLQNKCRRIREACPGGHAPTASGNFVEFGNLKLDLVTREVFIGDRKASLTPLEFKILRLFLSAPNQIHSRKSIIEEVWQDSRRKERLIDVQIALLRKKLTGFSGEIRSLYGQGYLIRDIKG